MIFIGRCYNPVELPDNRRVEFFKEILYNDIVSVNSQGVLSEIIGSNAHNKAVVLDAKNCNWSKFIIGLPSVVKAGNKLALFYDGNKSLVLPQGNKSHMYRDIGMAWLKLPITLP